MSVRCVLVYAWLETATSQLANFASNFSFGLVAFSEVNGILVLLATTSTSTSLAQISVAFPHYPIILGTFRV